MSDTTHPCARPDCDIEVPLSILACRADWRILPKNLRDEVWRAWRGVLAGAAGAISRHDRAVAECVAWWTSSSGTLTGSG